MTTKPTTPIGTFWRDYLRNKRAARRGATSPNNTGQHRQRTIPPKKGKGSYSRKGAGNG
jgi:stalled ribosome alternative rescue factor ArfA